MKTITVNGFYIDIIETDDGYTATISTDTQTAVFIDHLKTERDVEAYIAECKMLFSLLGKEHDTNSFS